MRKYTKTTDQLAAVAPSCLLFNLMQKMTYNQFVSRGFVCDCSVVFTRNGRPLLVVTAKILNSGTLQGSCSGARHLCGKQARNELKSNKLVFDKTQI